jgi:tetratricopeptide (TPR) repeat protein
MTVQPKPNLKEKLALLERFLAKGDLIAAESTARLLLAAYPRRSEASHALGRVLLQQGRPELAEEHLRRAAEAEKTHVGHRLDLGQCLLLMGRVVEAEAQYERARALAPRSHQVNWRWGSYLVAIGHGEEALGAFDAALAAAPPQDSPQIRLDRVDCLLSLGRTEEAEAEIRARLDTTPFRSRYVVLLSQIGRPDASSEVFGLIERELARPGLVPLARSDLLLRQGSLLAASGRHEEAFRSWMAAKQLLGAPARSEDFDRVVEERINAFPAATITALSALYGTPGPAPVFVIGLPRSGTTLVSEILAAHDAIGNAGEIETMTWIAAKLRGTHPLAGMAGALAEQGPEKIRALARQYQEVAAHLARPKPRSVDKMPNNFLYVGEIAILFPDARFIDCTRHPGDIFISAVQTEMNAAHSYSYEPQAFARHHRAQRRLMRHWKEALPGRIFDLGYERLVTEPRAVVAELLAFLGLPWQEACLWPGANVSTVRTFSRLQVRSAIHAGSVGRWKPYAPWLGPILEAPLED